MKFLGVGVAVAVMSYCQVHPLSIGLVGVLGFMFAMFASEFDQCSCKKCAKE